MVDNKILDFQTELINKKAQEILAELNKKHKETGECGIYDITPDGKIGEKLHGFND